MTSLYDIMLYPGPYKFKILVTLSVFYNQSSIFIFSSTKICRAYWRIIVPQKFCRGTSKSLYFNSVELKIPNYEEYNLMLYTLLYYFYIKYNYFYMNYNRFYFLHRFENSTRWPNFYFIIFYILLTYNPVFVLS